MAGNIEVAKAFVTIVPTLEGSQGTITKELTGITSEASEKAGSEGGSKFGDKFASALKGTGAAIGAAMTAATGAAIATSKAFVSAAKETSNYADEVDKMSQKVGFSTDSYQSFDYVLKICGTEMSSMTTGMKTLTNKFDDAINGSADAQAMFESLGLSMEDLAGMSREDLFANVVKGFQQMEDTTERAALANDLFGKSGQNLTPLFNMETSEMEALIAQAEDLGMVMGEDDVKAGAAFKDSMTTLSGTLTGLKNDLMSEFMPGLTAVTNGLAQVFGGNSSGIGQIKSGLTEIITKLTQAAPQFFQLAQTLIMSLIDGFAPQIPALATTIFSVLNQALVALVSLLPKLLPAIEDGISTTMKSVLECLPIIISSLLVLISDLATWLSEGDNIKTLIDGIVELVSLVAAQFAQVLPVLLPAIVKIIGDVANELMKPKNVLTIVSAALSILAAVVTALIKAVPELINFVIGSLNNILDAISSFTSAAWPIFKAGLDKIVEKFKEWGTSVKDFVVGLISTVKEKFTSWIDGLKTSFSDGFETVKTKISDIIENIKTFCSDAIGKISELPDKALDIGKDLISGLWNGINDKTQWVLDKIAGIASKITSKVKDVFGVASPSKTFAEIGGFLAEGLGVGWSDEIGNVESDMLKSADGLTASMTGTVTAVGTSNASTVTGTTVNNGGNTINVYAAEGQNVEELAQVIAIKLEQMTKRKGAVYA